MKLVNMQDVPRRYGVGRDPHPIWAEIIEQLKFLPAGKAICLECPEGLKRITIAHGIGKNIRKKGFPNVACRVDGNTFYIFLKPKETKP